MDAPACAAFGIEGELTIYRAAERCADLRAAFAGLARGATVEIDLAAVTDMDSAGVQLLMAARKTSQALGCGMRLVRHSAAVIDVLRTLDLDRHFSPLPPAAAH